MVAMQSLAWLPWISARSSQRQLNALFKPMRCCSWQRAVKWAGAAQLALDWRSLVMSGESFLPFLTSFSSATRSSLSSAAFARLHHTLKLSSQFSVTILFLLARQGAVLSVGSSTSWQGSSSSRGSDVAGIPELSILSSFLRSILLLVDGLRLLHGLLGVTRKLIAASMCP